MEVHRKNGSQPWTLTALRAILRDEIDARDKAEHTFGGKSNKEQGAQGNRSNQFKYQKVGKSGNHSPPTASALLAPNKEKNGPARSSQSQMNVPKCAYCGEAHYSDECSKFPDVDSRKQQLYDACFICLRRNHKAKDCRSRKPCYHCGGLNHNRSLCMKRFGRSESASVVTHTQNSSADDTEEMQHVEATIATHSDEVEASIVSQDAAALHARTASPKVFMQTAQAEISGPRGRALARILFDTGATKSFITMAKAKELESTRRNTVNWGIQW
jgi:hypothetical protein